MYCTCTHAGVYQTWSKCRRPQHLTVTNLDSPNRKSKKFLKTEPKRGFAFGSEGGATQGAAKKHFVCSLQLPSTVSRFFSVMHKVVCRSSWVIGLSFHM